MLMAVSAIKGFAISASDGKLGSVGDLLFDDLTWKVRWLVIDTGGWLSGRKVVIHPSAISEVAAEEGEVRVALTKAQVEASPDLSAHEPVSRQAELQVFDYYGWDPDWGSSYFIPGAMAAPLSPAPYFGADLSGDGPPAAPEAPEGDPHLQSMTEITGYHLRAVDGAIGHVENIFIDDRAWDVRYFIVDTGGWLTGTRVLLSPFAVKEIDFAEREIHLDVTQEQVKASPPWEPEKMIDEIYEKRLHRHYNWLGYGFSAPVGQSPASRAPAGGADGDPDRRAL